MNTKNLVTVTPEIKRVLIGGRLASGIYAPGSLADRLREARKYNTMDNGAPPLNSDGTRTYRLVETPELRCPFCKVHDPGFTDADFDDCPVECETCGHKTTLSAWKQERPAYPSKHVEPVIGIDDSEIARLRLLLSVQEASSARHTGYYWLDALGLDRAIVRWVEGSCEESVCLIDFEKQHALFLHEMCEAHRPLLESVENLGWRVHRVDGLVAPACPRCDGAGCIYESIDFPSGTISGSIDCGLCCGEGVIS